MDEVEDEEDAEQGGGGSIQADLARSYLAFGLRALRKHRIQVISIFLVGVGLTVAAAAYIPRTYSCTTVLLAIGNPVLDSHDPQSALIGAVDLIKRHENLKSIIQELGLMKEAAARKPSILRLKDRIVRAVFGEQSDKIKEASLVGTLETKITVSSEKGDLTIKAEWTDGKTAAELAQAARESFIKARHTAEISAFEEKMTILDGYSVKLRTEIGSLAQDLKATRDAKLNEMRAESRAPNPSSATAPAKVLAPLTQRPAEADTQIPALREKLQTLKAKLATVEADHDRLVREQQAKFEDMKLRLTALHPEVITQGARVAQAQQVPSSTELLRAEVKDIEGELEVREATQHGSTSIGRTANGHIDTGTEALPANVNELLQGDNLDPGLTAQLSSTVMKYTALRNDLLSTRIDLDTAQAAFNHRYQVIVPAEVPTAPDKPKPAMIWGAGLFLALLLSLAVPISRELKRGVIAEPWQIHNLRLPVLAELRLPPNSSD